jgi:YVTN family beta-propeller protein
MSKPIAAVIAIAALSLLAGRADAAEFLYVHNTMSGEISVIDLRSHEVVSTIKIGVYMDFVTSSPSGDVLYVNRVEPLDVPNVRQVGETGELIAINPSTEEILWRIKLDGMPHHMTVSKDGRLIFVPYYDSWWVAVVDVAERKVIKKIFTGNGGHCTELSADGKRLYVGSMMNDLIWVIDTESLQVVRRIPFSDAVRPFDFTSDEKTMYVQLSRYHGFVVVDLPSGKIARKVDLPALPEGTRLPEFYPHTYNHGIKLTPDEKLLFANASVGNYVAVYSHPDLRLIKTIPVGTDPNYVIFSRDGKHAYVSNRGSNDLSVISVSELKEIKRIKLGSYPQRMVIIDVPNRSPR